MKNLKTILIATVPSLIIGVSAFFLLGFRDNAVNETQQDNKIINNQNIIDSNLEYCKDNNKAVNLRITKENDLNRLEHEKIINKVDSNSQKMNRILTVQSSMNAKIDILLIALNLAQNEQKN